MVRSTRLRLSAGTAGAAWVVVGLLACAPGRTHLTWSVDPGSAAAPLELPRCTVVPLAPPVAWDRATSPDSLAEAPPGLVVRVVDARGRPLPFGAVWLDTAGVRLGGAAGDSVGIARVAPPAAPFLLTVGRVGFTRVTVPVKLRGGYTDTAVVALRPMCQGSERAPDPPPNVTLQLTNRPEHVPGGDAPRGPLCS
jgi:hypothetical protein